MTCLIFTVVHQYIKIYCKSINGFEGFEGFEDDATDENIENETEEEEKGEGEEEEEEKRENEDKENIEDMENKQDTNDSDNVNEFEKLQEQTKILLDTHNELIKNIETLKPYLKEAKDYTKSISKIMNGSSTENFE
jgi:TATA-binding protein-associated factor Taf7